MRRLYLAAQVAIAGVVLYFVARSLGRHWEDIRGAGHLVSLDVAALVAAGGIILATYALLISAWRAVLLGWGERLRYPSAARIWCLSNLARYVPGRIWQIAGMAAMAQRSGVSPWAAAGSAVVVQLVAVTTGALVTGLTAAPFDQPVLVATAGAVAAAAVASLAWRPATDMLSRLAGRLTGRSLRLEPVAARPLLLAAAVTTMAWISFGLALYFLVRGVSADAHLAVGPAIGAFTASYLVGLLLVFLPAGIGAREGTIYIMLLGPLGPATATVVTIASRLLMTVAELLAAAITLTLPNHKSPEPDASQA